MFNTTFNNISFIK